MTDDEAEVHNKAMDLVCRQGARIAELERELASARVVDLQEHRDDVLEYAAALCELQVDRDPEYGGRFGGYGPWKGDKTGPECAALIRSCKRTTPVEPPVMDFPEKLPCAVFCEGGPTFGNGVKTKLLLNYLGRRVGYNQEPNYRHTCGLPERDWSREGPSKDCPLCKARAAFRDLRDEAQRLTEVAPPKMEYPRWRAVNAPPDGHYISRPERPVFAWGGDRHQSQCYVIHLPPLPDTPPKERKHG